MKKTILIIFFLQKTFTQIWNFNASTIDLLSSNIYKSIIYDETENDFHIKLLKYINFTGNIMNNNYVKKNNEEAQEVDWEDIYNIYHYNNHKYICPKGKSHLIDYSSNKIEEIKSPFLNMTNTINNWELTCYFSNDSILISYLGSKDKHLYIFNITNGSWDIIPTDFEFYDILWPNKEIYYRKTIYIMALLLLENEHGEKSLRLGEIRLDISDKKISIENETALITSVLDKSNAFFDENNYFYWISYDDNLFQSGYSTTPLSEDIRNIDMNNDILIKNNSWPSSLSNIKIHYINFIRNTKYVYYKIESNNNIYHGIFDIKMNKIVFNTNIMMNYYKPISKYSLLAITKTSAYEICINGIDKGKCIDECPPGKTIIIDTEKGNYCGGNELCDNYILTTNNSCIDKCNETIYTFDEHYCGYCKHLNKSFPYKNIKEKLCQKEKPNNTFFLNEKFYILDYCHSSCETCNGGSDNHCLSCKDGLLLNGKCISECKVGYYSNITNCLKCESNCLTCNKGKENNNNHCLSCNETSGFPFLFKVEELDGNCVDQCPNNTILDNSTKQCIFNKKKDKYKSPNNSIINEKKSIPWIGIFLLLLFVAIIIFTVIIVYVKCFRKKMFEKESFALKDDVLRINDYNITLSDSNYYI